MGFEITNSGRAGQAAPLKDSESPTRYAPRMPRDMATHRSIRARANKAPEAPPTPARERRRA